MNLWSTTTDLHNNSLLFVYGKAHKSQNCLMSDLNSSTIRSLLIVLLEATHISGLRTPRQQSIWSFKQQTIFVKSITRCSFFNSRIYSKQRIIYIVFINNYTYGTIPNNFVLRNKLRVHSDSFIKTYFST